MTDTRKLNEYATAEHALKYLSIADKIPHRTEGEAVLLSFLPQDTRRILDLGTGDGRLLGLARLACPSACGIALDFSETMLEAAERRFLNDDRVQVVAHDLDDPLPDFEPFDAIISSFAIHHCSDQRKQSLYSEVFTLLAPGGVFCNLEHVAPASEPLHEMFMQSLGMNPGDEDPSNQLAAVSVQLAWLDAIGFQDVDCHWKWLELGLLAGRRPDQP